MEFDVSKYSSSNSKSLSHVKAYQTEHSSKLSENDLHVAMADLMVTTPLCGFIGLNLAVLLWQWVNVPISLICPIWGIVVSLVAILRYSHTIALQSQPTWQRGKLQWDKETLEQNSNGKTHVKFVREQGGYDEFTGNEIKINSISLEKLRDLADAVIATNSYSQKILVDNKIVSPRNYDSLSQELLANRIIRYKSDNPKQGYELTDYGINQLSSLRGAK